MALITSSQPETPPRAEGSSLAAVLIPIATLGGALFYALLRALYARFYATFSVTPEQVGIGYQQALTAAASVALFVSTPTIGALITGWLVSYVGNRVLALIAFLKRGDGARTRTPNPPVPRPRAARLIPIAFFATLSVLAILFSLGRAQLDDAKQSVIAGLPVNSSAWSVLHLEVPAARVQWVGSEPIPRPLLNECDELLLIGAIGDDLVFFDADQSGAVDRWPASALAVTTDWSERGLPECRQGKGSRSVESTTSGRDS